MFLHDLYNLIGAETSAGNITPGTAQKLQSMIKQSGALELPHQDQLFETPPPPAPFNVHNFEDLAALQDDDPNKYAEYWAWHYQYVSSIDWNTYNELKRTGYSGLYNIADCILKVPHTPSGQYISSGFEAHLIHNTPFKNALYEPKGSALKFWEEKEYRPDFVSRLNPRIMFEAKGVLRTREEANKYLRIIEQNPDHTLIFIILKPNTQLPYQKKRKNGSKMTMEEWCDKNNIMYCYPSNASQFLRSPRYQALLAA